MDKKKSLILFGFVLMLILLNLFVVIGGLIYNEWNPANWQSGGYLYPSYYPTPDQFKTQTDQTKKDAFVDFLATKESWVITDKPPRDVYKYFDAWSGWNDFDRYVKKTFEWAGDNPALLKSLWEGFAYKLDKNSNGVKTLGEDKYARWFLYSLRSNPENLVKLWKVIDDKQKQDLLKRLQDVISDPLVMFSKDVAEGGKSQFIDIRNNLLKEVLKTEDVPELGNLILELENGKIKVNGKFTLTPGDFKSINVKEKDKSNSKLEVVLSGDEFKQKITIDPRITGTIDKNGKFKDTVSGKEIQLKGNKGEIELGYDGATKNTKISFKNDGKEKFSANLNQEQPYFESGKEKSKFFAKSGSNGEFELTTDGVKVYNGEIAVGDKLAYVISGDTPFVFGKDVKINNGQVEITNTNGLTVINYGKVNINQITETKTNKNLKIFDVDSSGKVKEKPTWSTGSDGVAINHERVSGSTSSTPSTSTSPGTPGTPTGQNIPVGGPTGQTFIPGQQPPTGQGGPGSDGSENGGGNGGGGRTGGFVPGQPIRNIFRFFGRIFGFIGGGIRRIFFWRRGAGGGLLGRLFGRFRLDIVLLCLVFVIKQRYFNYKLKCQKL